KFDLQVVVEPQPGDEDGPAGMAVTFTYATSGPSGFRGLPPALGRRPVPPPPPPIHNPAR
ncbi:hypothetical protein, partial [Nocardia abscessus]|uniref:hypothetical protein n=1 Tax=Nocardia abscessus TaxID=120957 RepID=UPI002456E425